MNHETQPDLLGQIMATTDEALATLIETALTLTYPDIELDAALADLGRQGDCHAADMVREARFTTWAAVRTLEALSQTLHNELDWF